MLFKIIYKFHYRFHFFFFQIARENSNFLLFINYVHICGHFFYNKIEQSKKKRFLGHLEANSISYSYIL